MNFQNCLLLLKNRSTIAETFKSLTTTMEVTTSLDIFLETISLIILKLLSEEEIFQIYLTSTTKFKSTMSTSIRKNGVQNTEPPTAMVATSMRMTSHARHSQLTPLTMERLSEYLETKSSLKNREGNLPFSLPHAPISRHLPETGFQGKETKLLGKEERETLAATIAFQKRCAIDPKKTFIFKKFITLVFNNHY